MWLNSQKFSTVNQHKSAINPVHSSCELSNPCQPAVALGQFSTPYELGTSLLDDPRGDALRFAQTPRIWEDLGMVRNPISTLVPILCKPNFKNLTWKFLRDRPFEPSPFRRCFRRRFYAVSSMVPGCRELGHSMPNFTASSMSSVRNSEASFLTSNAASVIDGSN